MASGSNMSLRHQFFMSAPKVTVMELPTWLPYSHCSYLCLQKRSKYNWTIQKIFREQVFATLTSLACQRLAGRCWEPSDYFLWALSFFLADYLDFSPRDNNDLRCFLGLRLETLHLKHKTTLPYRERKDFFSWKTQISTLECCFDLLHQRRPSRPTLRAHNTCL